MSSAGKYRVIRYFAYAIELLAVFVLQETPGLVPAIAGARPVLLLPVVLSIAMFEPETPAMAFGLAGGLLIDSGISGVLGFHALFLAGVCYAVSLITANLFQTNFLTALLVAVSSTALFVFLQWVFYFILCGYSYPFYALTVHYLPMFIYTSAVMPIAYYFNHALALQIRSKEE